MKREAHNVDMLNNDFLYKSPAEAGCTMRRPPGLPFGRANEAEQSYLSTAQKNVFNYLTREILIYK